MNTRYLTLDEDSPAVLKGVLWALSTGAALVVFVLLMWLGIQRNETMVEKRYRISAEQQRDAACIDRDNIIRTCNAQVARAESARMEAENRIMVAVQAKNQAEAKCAQDEQQLQVLRLIQGDAQRRFVR